MPFITDDYESELVDDDDYYGNDKYKNWVIARTLMYGEIESTELTKNGRGYVTFSCDRHACLAYNLEKGVKVADTWHQPSIATPTNRKCEDRGDDGFVGEQDSPFPQLNHDCLYEIFGRCANESLVHLAETCKRFRDLLTTAYKFPNRELKLETFKTLLFTKMSMSLTMVRKIFRLIGPYLQKFDFDFLEVDEHVISHYWKAILRHCETNTRIHTLKLRIETWSDIYNPLIESNNLQTLNVFIANQKDYPDFISMCPKLENLIIGGLLDEDDYHYGPSTWKFRAKNLQIKTLTYTALIAKYLPDLITRLPNVDKFTWVIYGYSSLKFFRPLRKFGQLKELKLLFDTYSQIVDLSRLLTTFNGLNSLKELKLYFKNAPLEIQQLTVLARFVPNLERLDLLGVPGIETSTVVNFVQDSEKLQSFHVHHSKFFATESLLTQLCSVRKCLNREKLNLYLDGSGPETTDDIERYINIQYNCSHKLWSF